MAEDQAIMDEFEARMRKHMADLDKAGRAMDKLLYGGLRHCTTEYEVACHIWGPWRARQMIGED